MEADAKVKKGNRVWRMLTDRLRGINLNAIAHALGDVFTKCNGKQSTQSKKLQETIDPQSISYSRAGYHTNAELLEQLTALESRFQQQNEILERHGLRQIQIAPRSIKPAQRYHGDIEPDIKQDPLAVLLAKVRPDRYDDERFDKLERLVQKFMVARVSHGKGGSSSRPVRKDWLYVC